MFRNTKIVAQKPKNIFRAWGNRKGIFTRDRKPKTSAHLLRSRYWKLTALLEGSGPDAATTTETPPATNGVSRPKGFPFA